MTAPTPVADLVVALIVAIIAALPPTLLALAALLVALRTGKDVSAVSADVAVVRHQTNAMTTQLVAAGRAEGKAEGITQILSSPLAGGALDDAAGAPP